MAGRKSKERKMRAAKESGNRARSRKQIEQERRSGVHGPRPDGGRRKAAML